jgi:hypothetical protein
VGCNTPWAATATRGLQQAVGCNKPWAATTTARGLQQAVGCNKTWAATTTRGLQRQPVGCNDNPWAATTARGLQRPVGGAGQRTDEAALGVARHGQAAQQADRVGHVDHRDLVRVRMRVRIGVRIGVRVRVGVRVGVRDRVWVAIEIETSGSPCVLPLGESSAVKEASTSTLTSNCTAFR